MKRSYKWTYLYAAIAPTSGESFCMYLPGMDDGCLEIFLEELSKSYPDHHLLVVLDGAPSHRSEQIVHQPSERLWPLSDEAVANHHFEEIGEMEEALAGRCVALSDQPEIIRSYTRYHWWPNAA